MKITKLIGMGKIVKFTAEPFLVAKSSDKLNHRELVAKGPK